VQRLLLRHEIDETTTKRIEPPRRPFMNDDHCLHSDTLVLKLGGSVLRSTADLPRAVSEVYRHWRAGTRVVAVVSALGPTTDELLQRAEQLGLPPSSSAFPAYLGSGEATAAALLTLALHRAGLPAALLDAAALRLVASGDPTDADPTSIDLEPLRRVLADRTIAVVPGFVARDHAGAAVVLGRGGSDLTALFVAAELGAGCTLLKDVGGLYTADPAREAQTARRWAAVSWETARAVAGGAVQDKALRFAAARRLTFLVCGPGEPAGNGTAVGTGPDRLHARATRTAPRLTQPLRVALLGCGTVGGGVLRHLLARRDRYQLVGVAVRRPQAHPNVPREWLRPVDELLDGQAEVVVEATGSPAAAEWIETALRAGRHVVTAGKAILAEHGVELAALAAQRGVRLLGSAAVGGALPALETMSRLAGGRGVLALRGVLNGTSSYVFDRIAAGDELASAVREAQRLGFAEADPACDLDGTDAAQKLALLIRAAWGTDVPWRTIPRLGLDGWTARRALGDGVWRLVAEARQTSAGLIAHVEPVRLATGDALARASGAAAALEVATPDGAVVHLHAQGAGRWPTAEAVLADLEDLRLACDERNDRGGLAVAAVEDGAGRFRAPRQLPGGQPALEVAP
jgi:homoserine dehydrogenase